MFLVTRDIKRKVYTKRGGWIKVGARFLGIDALSFDKRRVYERIDFFFFHISLGGASPGERQGRDRVSKRVKEEEEEEGEEAVRGIDRFPRGLGQLKDSNGR